MSKLLTVVYQVADIRARCQLVHDARFGLSPRKLMQAIAGKPPIGFADQAAELAHLGDRLNAVRSALDSLDVDDLAIRSGRQLNDTLRRYVEVLTVSVETLERLCDAAPRAEDEDIAGLKVVYDDALQRQKQLADRLNELLSKI